MQYGFSAPDITKSTKIILISTVGIFLLSSILNASSGVNLASIFGLSYGGLTRGYIFSLLTYPFVHLDLMSVIFNLLVIWFFGADLEARWGTRSYWFFLGLVTLGSGLFYVLVTFFFPSMHFYPLFGLHGVATAMVFVYAFLYPDRQMAFMMMFPMKALHFCLILVAMELYMALFSSGGKASWAHLVAMAIGWGFARYRGGLTLFAKGPKNIKKGRGNLFVIKGDKDDDGPKYWQ